MSMEWLVEREPRYFARCSVDELKRAKYVNKPINLSHCMTLYKCTDNPSSEYDKYPAIAFKMVDGKLLYWLYADEADRDADYERIVR